MQSLTCQQVRELDRRAIEEFGIPGIVLMENAGRGVADVLEQTADRGPVTILCGAGNNAGDGFVIARHLDLRGYPVRIVTCTPTDRYRADTLTNFQIVQRSGIEMADWSSPPPESWWGRAAWIIDALLGTGSAGPPRPPLDAAIERANRCADAKRLAVDLPSGLNADTGQVSPATVRADITCTFVAAKPGLLAPEAAPFVGRLHIVDIGAPGQLVRQMLAKSAQ
jgi:NAD(P)H-hydrate epimerase